MGASTGGSPGQRKQSSRASREPAPGALSPTTGAGYLDLTRRPLYGLVFILPLLLAYELGVSLHLNATGQDGAVDLEAHRLLSGLWEAFGVAGMHLPAATVIVVLLAWHWVREDPMRLRPGVLGGMAAEAVVLSLPLLVLAPLIGQLAEAGGRAAEPADLSLGARMTLALGAGVYEEFLFRLIGISAVHALASDLLRLPRIAGLAIAVMVTAAAFALFHPGSGGDWQGVRISAYYVLAGIYFGVVYALRGFGVAVGVHVVYDLIVLLLLADGL